MGKTVIIAQPSEAMHLHDITREELIESIDFVINKVQKQPQVVDLDLLPVAELRQVGATKDQVAFGSWLLWLDGIIYDHPPSGGPPSTCGCPLTETKKIDIRDMHQAGDEGPMYPSRFSLFEFANAFDHYWFTRLGVTERGLLNIKPNDSSSV